MTRYSGNTATAVEWTFGGEGTTAKVYVDDELGRHICIASLSLSTNELRHLLTGIERRRDELEQPPLFGEAEDQGDTNVRWLPPQP